MALHLEITVDYMAIPAEVAWEMLHASHAALLTTSQQASLYGDVRSLGDMTHAIKKRGKPHFAVEFAGGEFDYIPVGNSHLGLVIVKNWVQGFDDAWAWVNPFARLKEFRSARVYDHEFEYWENASDPREYISVGRSYVGLPMKSNGLPCPLKQMLIDTSANPGRRVLRQGYVEAVGAVMWLGEQFWALTGARKKDVLCAKWLKCEEMPHGVVRVQAADEPFTTSEGSAGELQHRLRALLFPQSQ